MGPKRTASHQSVLSCVSRSSGTGRGDQPGKSLSLLWCGPAGGLAACAVGFERPDPAVVEIVEEFAVAGGTHVPGPDNVGSIHVRFVIDPLIARGRDLAVADQDQMLARELTQFSKYFGPVGAGGQGVVPRRRPV